MRKIVLLFATVMIGLTWATLAVAATGSHVSSYDPLLQVLMRKGIISEREARRIQNEAKVIEEQQKTEMAKEIRKNATPKALKGLKFQMLSYLDYSAGKSTGSHGGQKSYNRFTIKRGYFRVTKKMTPWLDFEEHVNPYRCQGTMAIERAGTFNSADLGVSNSTLELFPARCNLLDNLFF